MMDNILKNLQSFDGQDRWKYCSNFRNVRKDNYGLREVSDIDYFIDIGSCLGEISYMAHVLYNKPMIIAIEPCRTTFDFLKKNIGYLSNIYLENKGIYKESNKLLWLSHNIKNIGANQINEKSELINGETIETITLEDLFIKYNINLNSNIFLKIDCEGCEQFLFHEPVIKYCLQISMEIHEKLINNKQICDNWFNQIRDTHKIIKGNRKIGHKYEIIFKRK
jgi:FkbM family methyltransferase